MLATRIGGERRSSIPMSGSSFGAQPMAGGLKANWDKQMRYTAGGKLMSEKGRNWTNMGQDFSGYLGGIQERAGETALRGWGGQPAPARRTFPATDVSRDGAYISAYRSDRGSTPRLSTAALTPGFPSVGGPSTPDVTLKPLDDVGDRFFDQREAERNSVRNLSSLAGAGSVLSDPVRGIAGDSGIFGLADAMASKGLFY